MKIALVGIGYWGSKLLRNLVALVGVENVVAVDPHVDRLSQALAEYPGINGEFEVTAALADPDVSGVVIATPPATHAALAEQALRAGKHVFVEKPMTTSVADSTRLVDLAANCGLTLMVGHTFLFSPRVQWMRDHIRRGEAGAIHYVTSSRLNLGIHQSDANVVWDLGPHDISIIQYLLDEVPSEVRCSARGLAVPEVPDVAFIDLAFPSGVIASIQVSWMAPKKVRNLTLVGDRDMLVYDDTDGEEPVKVYNRGVDRADSSDFGENQLTYRFGDTIVPHIDAAEPLRRELQEFLGAVEYGTTPLSDGTFGLGVVATLEAADRSLRARGELVEVGMPKLVDLS
ncbi:MAG: Gfo/Idh/MocA family oxidoreductase [Acidimicrobiales bacterium]|nr:Gfo/Idh/MocA family oxidoreductase [Acidimicrobiales bacterium]